MGVVAQVSMFSPPPIIITIVITVTIIINKARKPEMHEAEAAKAKVTHSASPSPFLSCSHILPSWIASGLLLGNRDNLTHSSPERTADVGRV